MKGRQISAYSNKPTSRPSLYILHITQTPKHSPHKYGKGNYNYPVCIQRICRKEIKQTLQALTQLNRLEVPHIRKPIQKHNFPYNRRFPQRTPALLSILKSKSKPKNTDPKATRPSPCAALPTLILIIHLIEKAFNHALLPRNQISRAINPADLFPRAIFNPFSLQTTELLHIPTKIASEPEPKPQNPSHTIQVHPEPLLQASSPDPDVQPEVRAQRKIHQANKWDHASVSSQ